MKRLYAVIRSRGAAWEDHRGLEQQHDWAAHAAFMDNLEREGFVILGGPLEETRDVLLIVRAEGAEDVNSRLEEDPWTLSGLLVTRQVSHWRLRLGALP